MNTQKSAKIQTIFSEKYWSKKIHFLGIGGSGMSGIAKILLSEGYKISGSDLVPNLITQQLIDLGAQIYFNHCPENINDASIIVVSSAILSDNPEIVAAREAHIPIIKRAEMLAELMRFRHGIVVAGTHGKTTTTGMIVSIYVEAGLDPTFINGGLITGLGINARLGRSNYLIAEADESDTSFLYLQPIVAIITNIEADHIDTYHGNLKVLKQTFIKFLHNLPCHGHAIMCIDDRIVCEILPHIKRKITTYGFRDDADFRIIDYYQDKFRSSFILIRHGKVNVKIKLNVPGRHNALNAVAAIAVATEDGIDDEVISKAMLEFQGINRRFEILGYYNLTNNLNGEKGEIILVDDYGHHPTELNATIQAARTGWPTKRLVMVFQPHRYTRMSNLYNDFVSVLLKVDVLLLLDVYSAGEAPMPNAESCSLCKTIRSHGQINPILVSDINLLPLILMDTLKDNDLLIMQGAGTIGTIARQIRNVMFK